MNPPIEIAAISGPAYDPLYQRLPDFERNTGNRVAVKFRGDHPALNRHFAEVSELPYDLVSTHTKYAPSQKHLLAPLDHLVPPDVKQDFVPLLLDLASVDGKLFGLPRNIDVRLLHYRTDVIQEPPKTWDALFELAAAKNVPPEMYGFVFPGRESGLFGTFYELTEMAGGSVFPTNLVPDIQNDAGRWAVGFLRSLYIEGLVPRQLPDWHYDKVHECFRSGHAAMVGDWPGYYGLYRDTRISCVADRFDVSIYPAGPAGKSLAYGGGHTFALTKRGADKPEAHELLFYLTNPEQQLLEARNGCVPVRKSVMQQMQSEADDKNRTRLRLLEEVINEHILVPPKFDAYPYVEEVLWQTVQQAFTGQIEIDEALQRMTKRIEDIVRNRGRRNLAAG